MTFDDLQPIIQSVSAISDLTTLILNIKQLKTKISGKTFTDAQQDTTTIENILTECFIRKEILWQQVDYENFDWSINSLINLQGKCDEYTQKFLTTNNDTQHFYSQLMRLLGDASNETYKELYRNKDNPNYDLFKPLKTMRQKCYKIIVTFTQLLPDGNLTKTKSFEKLELGCKHTKLTIKQILPEWAIE